MNSTPRMKSRFPDASPHSHSKSNHGSLSNGPRKSSTALPRAPAPHGRATGPLIPLDTIDAPQQRLLIVSFYVALFAWRLYDFHYLNEGETESLWMFMKWVAIDGLFLFGLPELRIPWLEWSMATIVVAFLLHSIVDGILMFRIQIPLGSAVIGLAKIIYDRELTLSEHHVKQSSLIHDQSLFLGRQTIKILPEGSATLNPAKESFCLTSGKTQIYLPVLLNQTTPVSLNLVRFDLETNQNETTHFSASQLKKLLKEASKTSTSQQLQTIKLSVHKPGLYRLGKVVDQSDLEVRRRLAGDTFVVACPRAIIKPLSQNKCRGDLMNVELQVTGTPPLKVKYRKLINQVEQEAQLQSIQPDDFVSPLSSKGSSALVSSKKIDATWAKEQTVSVPLSESLGTTGRWAFSLEEVQDAFGNLISYSRKDHDSQEKSKALAPYLHQVVTVHERPTIMLNGCSAQHPMKVARGRSADLPVQFGSTGKSGNTIWPYHLEYKFTPEFDLSPSGDHRDSPIVESLTVRHAEDRPRITNAGLYTLTGVSTEHCSGEVLEPASCLLQNPPEPRLQLETERIFDNCAHKAIGLRVDFHLSGTPPFEIHYVEERRGTNQRMVKTIKVPTLRGQANLTPDAADHWIYHFTDISDATYKGHSLRDQNLVLEQDVKPAARASFTSRPPKMICIDQTVRFGLALRGDGPFTVEYELVRGHQRSSYKISDIKQQTHDVETPPFTKGGDYTLSLASITDGVGCKEFLKDETKIVVRNQKPKANFGLIEGSRSVKTLENKKVALPIRLTGDGPWTVEYKHNGQNEKTIQTQLRQANDKIEVDKQGSYELLSVQDAICPGVVDQTANKLDIQWIHRPSLIMSADAFQNVDGQTYVKHDICEGEDDTASIHVNGSPPFEIKYDERIKPESGQKAIKSRTLTAALGMTSIRMDTSKAGLVEYRFSELADANYDHSPKHFGPLTIQQQVHAKPFARFTTPGKTYNYCTSLSTSVDTIPLTLTGTPPFSIDYEIRQSGKTSPKIHTIGDIRSHNYDLKIPTSDLQIGTSAVSIRKVTDARHCSRTLASTEPRVQISVHAAPSISPLESSRRTDFCIGDRLSYVLSGVAPFTIFYTFNGVERKASSTSTTFRRLAEKPGRFAITGVSDSGSSCRATVNDIHAIIHGLPSAKVGSGKEAEQDIHEGGTAVIEFEFGGEGPWEFTYTRSGLGAGDKRKGAVGKKSGHVLEMKSEVSVEDKFSINAGEEGVYEVVRVKDRWCEVTKEGVELGGKQKLLT